MAQAGCESRRQMAWPIAQGFPKLTRLNPIFISLPPMRFLARGRALAVLLLALGASAALGAESGPRQVERNSTRYEVFVTSPGKVSIYWLGPDGKPFHQFSVLQKYLEERGRKIRFLMNGGIFAEGGIPCGLLIIDGKVLHPLNSALGEGNFYLQPNGVFFVDAQGAHVMSTAACQRRNPSPALAVQSGPLLLEHGRMHPAFRAGSTSRLHRNGVGIRADGSVVFAITEFGQARYPNLYEFAGFFRALGCQDALFLDGDISQMAVDPVRPITPGNFFGTILAVTD